LVLVTVVHKNGEFCLIASVNLAKAPDRNYFRLPRFILALNRDRHFTVVVNKADPRESFVRNPLTKLERLKIT
jgi:hypothetical protein